MMRLTILHASLTTQPKDRRPPEVFFSRCLLVFMLQKNKKTKNKKRKEMNKGPATFYLGAVRETT